MSPFNVTGRSHELDRTFFFLAYLPRIAYISVGYRKVLAYNVGLSLD